MNVPSEPHPSVPAPSAGNALGVDEELLALPAPPRGKKWVTAGVLVAAALASSAVAWSLRHDASYALVAEAPSEVGDLGAWQGSRAGYVRARGTVSAARAIRYDRALTPGSYRLFPVWRPESSERPVWVEVHLPEGVDAARFIPPDTFEGRLVRFDEAGPRYRGLISAVARETGAKIDAGSWLMIDEAKPAATRWALGMVAVFAAFAAWCVATLARISRRVRT